MTVEDRVSPQAGDPDEAELFAQLIGQSNQLDYVETGLEIDPDYGVGTATIGSGVCYVSRDEVTGSLTGETIRALGYPVQVAEREVDLPDSGEHYIVVEPNFGTTNSPYIEFYDDPTLSTSDALQIGIVDLEEGEVIELNRDPSIVVEHLEVEEGIESEEIDHALDVVESVEGDIDVLESDVSAVESDVSNIESNIDAIEGDITDLDDETDTQSTEIDVLETDLSTLEADFDGHVGDFNDLDSDVDSLETDVGVLETDVSTLETDVDTLETDISNVQGDIDDLEGDLAGYEIQKDGTDGTGIINFKTE